MQINHLTNGKSVTSSRYFETINPARQAVLVEVASGGGADVNAAVVAAKEAFPKWAGTPAPQRAKLIAANVADKRCFWGASHCALGHLMKSGESITLFICNTWSQS